MFSKEFNKSIRFQFLSVMSIIIFLSTVVLSTVIALNEEKRFEYSLMTKGQSFASYIAKLSLDPLIMRDYLQLEALVNEANKDEEIAYTLIQDPQGNLITTQYASINYMLPRLQTILSGMPKDSGVSDIVAAIKRREAVIELSAPIRTGDDTVGAVTIGMLEYEIHQQVAGTILFVIVLNLVVALALGAMLFYAAKRIILTPIAELSRAASRLAKGDLSAQVTMKTTGEMRQLVDSFNQMAADLEKTTVSRDYVDSIIHSMADTLLVINSDGTIRTVNASLIQLLGYEEEPVGKHLKTVFPNDSDEAEGIIRVIEKEGWADSIETVYFSRTGRRIPVLVSGATIRDKYGDSRGFVLIGKDITERKKAEERLQRYADELRESNNEIQSFSYIISHDLRAPLVSIKGFSAELDHAWKDIEAIIRKYLSEMDGKDRSRLDQLVRQDIYEALKFIASSADRMEGLINSILTLSRVGRRELKPEPVDMGTLTRRLVDSLAHQIGEKNIRVTIGTLPMITADRLAMEQVMGNLLDNAIKYSDAGKSGGLAVTAEERGEEHIFHVRDSGRGIAPDDIPKVFDIFKRVGRQNVPGEGMGLAYVKALVKRHNGRIWCDSEVGEGTTFSFSLPVPAVIPRAQGDGGGRS